MMSSRWLILAVLFSTRTVLAFQFQSLASIGSVVVRDLNIDFALLGTLVGLYMLPGVVFSIPGGMLGQRFGDKRVVLAGLALMATGGLLVATSQVYGVIAAGRVVSGLGAVLLNILLAKMLTDWFADRDLVLAMAIFVSSWPLGIAASLALVPWLTVAAGPAVGLGSTVLASLLALVLLAAAYSSPAGVRAGSAKLRIDLTGSEWALSILSGLVWALFNVGLILVFVFGPSLLTARGMGLAEAGLVTSVASWMVVFAIPLGGLLAQRFGSRDVWLRSCLLALAAAAWLWSSGASPVVASLLFGLFAGPPPGIIMSLPASALRPERRAAGMGVYYTVYYAGMTALVPAAGLVRDVTGEPGSPLWFAALLILGAALAHMVFLARRARPVTGAAPA